MHVEAMLSCSRVTYHGAHVLQFMEQHQFDGDESVIIGPNITHVVVELTGDTAQLCKLVMVRDEAAWVSGIGTMPFKLMQPVQERERGGERERERGREREGRRERERREREKEE